ncbi:hypothetical protein FA95DRAFT_1683143, partial [Auriscalpium vulgare]
MVDKHARTSQHGTLLFEPFIAPQPPRIRAPPARPPTLMAPDAPVMSLVTRSKLHLAHGSKDSCSLHRWVLLKNSIIHALPSASCAPAAANANANLVYSPEEEEEEEEVCCDDEHDSFMFPDAGKLANSAGDSMEEQWFDSLLETLEVDEEDAAVHASLLHADDDDDYAPFTPATSPMSSSDDLVSTP